MKFFISAFVISCALKSIYGAELRLLDLDPPEAQQYIDKQDTSLKYAPKIESNVPAVRFLGNEPHHVLEDIYLANQYHGQDGLGGYLYGYAVPDIAKTEKKKAGGDLRGAYNYIAGNGQEIKVEYWDDGTGFHQIDNVPKILPKQIDDTPEVKAAKDEHARIWQEQAERNSKPIPNPYDSHGNYAQQPEQYQQQYQQTYQQPQQQYQQPQKQYQQPQQQYQQPQQQYQQPQKQYQQPQQQYQQPQQQYQQPQKQYQQPQQQYQQPQQQYQQPQKQYQQYQQQQPQQLINEYQQQKQQYPNPGQPVQYQGDQQGQYYGEQSQNVNKYQASESQSSYGQSQAQAKQYNEEDEEEKGPPKGFFYSFDYPVGIIVQKEGAVQKREGDVKDVYATNKALFEQQLQGGARPAGSSTGYMFVKQ